MPTTGNRTRRFARFAIVLGTCAIALGYAAAFISGGPPVWAAWLLALGIPASIGGMLLLGAARGAGGVGRLWIPIAFVVVTLAAGFGFALALPADESAGSTLWLGLPVRAAIVIYGIGLMPAIILPVAYARTFEEHTLSEADVARVIAMGKNRA